VETQEEESQEAKGSDLLSSRDEEQGVESENLSKHHYNF